MTDNDDSVIQEGLKHQPTLRIKSIGWGTTKPDKTTPDGVLEDAQDLYEEKGEDWGEAWRDAGEMLSMMAGDNTIELGSAEDMISFALYWMRLVKMQRSFNGEFLTEGMNFEEASDSQEDSVCYASMHRANTEVKNND